MPYGSGTYAGAAYAGSSVVADSLDPTVEELLDGGSVGEPYLAIPWGPPVTTPFPPSAETPPEATIIPELAIEVVDEDHGHLTWLNLAQGGISVRGAVDDPGAISVTLAKKDPALANVGYNRLLHAWLRGELVAASLIEPRDDSTLQPGTGAQEVARIGGRGTRAFLERVVMDPWKLDWFPDMQAQRFNWAHPDFVDDDQVNWIISGWRSAMILAVQGWRSAWWTGYPVSWPDPDAMWIGGGAGTSYNAPPGIQYFRKKFEIETGGQHALFFTADNEAQVFIDGVEIGVTNNWQQLQRIDLELSTGTHVVAARVQNFGWLPTALGGLNGDGNLENPLGLLLSLFQTGSQGVLGPVVLRSSGVGGGVTESVGPGRAAAWRYKAFPAVVDPAMVTDSQLSGWNYDHPIPGWPIGQILNYVLDKDETNNGTRHVNRTFTGPTDSAGQAWPIVPDWTIPVGNNFEQIMQQLEESYCTFEMAPGSWTLSAWNGDANAINGPSLEDVSNAASEDDVAITDLTHRSAPPKATSVLVRYEKNWTRRSVTPPAGFTPVSTHLQIPTVKDLKAAQEAADKLLAVFGQERVEYRAGLYPRNDGQRPPLAFKHGDFIQLPDRDLVMQVVRCLSWDIAQDQNGLLAYSIEAGDRVAYEEERINQWLQRAADGAIEGESSAPLPNRLDTYKVQTSDMRMTPIPFDRDADVTAITSKDYPAHNWTLLIDASAKIPAYEDIQGTNTVCTINVDGVAVGSVTIPAGERAATMEPSLAYSVERAENVSVSCPQIGFDLVVVVRFT